MSPYHDSDEDWKPSAAHDAVADAHRQGEEARAFLDRTPDEFLHLPFPTVDHLVGGIAPGDVWFVAAFSGNGKTTLLLSLTLELLFTGRTVYYLGLETRPLTLRTQLACLRLGYHPGDVLSGKAQETWPAWDGAKGEIRADIDQQVQLAPRHRVIISGVQSVSAAELPGAFTDAAVNSADLLIIDHIDHVSADAGSTYAASRLAVEQVLRQAQRVQIPTLVATQTNNEGLRGDKLGLFQPPQPHHIFMGNHKRHIATGMLGLYRPLRDDVTKSEIRDARGGLLEPRDLLQRDTMGVVCMKHRHYGNLEGAKCTLRLERGRIRP